MNNSFFSDNILLGWIRESKLKEGDKLPSERKLSASLDLSRGELRKALMFLEMGGIIERFIGKGTFLSLNSTDLEKNEFSTITFPSFNTVCASGISKKSYAFGLIQTSAIDFVL